MVQLKANGWRRAAGSSAHRDRAKAFACDLFASQFWLYVIHTTSPQERPAAQTNIPPSISTSWPTRVRHYQGHLQVAAGVRFSVASVDLRGCFRTPQSGLRRIFNHSQGPATDERGGGGGDFKLCCCRWFFFSPWSQQHKNHLKSSAASNSRLNYIT